MRKHVADKYFSFPLGADPKYEEEVSGCTACVGLLTDDKIYVVRTAPATCPPGFLTLT